MIMTPNMAKKVLEHAKTVAQFAAETCKDDSNEINNQMTISTLMLATCIMGRFFNEDDELLQNLLLVMLAAVQEMPAAEEFMADFNIH